MDERRHEPERADENARGGGEQSQPSRSHAPQPPPADERGPSWRDADQPDGWRHSEDPPLTDRERRERWPLG